VGDNESIVDPRLSLNLGFECMSELDQYDYALPKELIAQHPLPVRADARLLVVDRETETISHSHVRNLHEFLRPADCLVFNNTRVIPAKLVGHKSKTGGRWHGLFLESDAAGHARLLCKTRGRLQPGDEIQLENPSGQADVKIVMLAKLNGGAWAVRAEPHEDWQEILKRIGRVPLPNYIRDGNMEPADSRNYQTVYAKHPGAVAAPTAGLHFTKELLVSLQAAGIEICQVTLHVGIGTFRPIKVDRLADHDMHSERGEIGSSTVERIKEFRAKGGRVFAIGTTSMRVLETASLNGGLSAWQGDTDLFIRPGFDFKTVDCLMTNFHLPRSTLLILVRAFGGDALMRRAYEEAIAQSYRFFSYGDAMLIL
jgi:S-adenosylmethionine:tRNA ribosyltransferase-isomerase